MARALQAVRSSLIASGESEGFAAAVEKKLGARPASDSSGGLDPKLVEEAGLKVKLEWYGNLYEELSPRCLRSSDGAIGMFRAEVLGWFMRAHSTVELLSLFDKSVAMHFAWHDAIQAAKEHSDKLRCPICMEPFLSIQIVKEDGLIDLDRRDIVSGETQTTWTPSLRRTEHWKSNPCGHVCCKPCMESWAAASIHDSKVHIRCPAVGCSHVLWDHDLKPLLNEEEWERYVERRDADHLTKLKDDMKDPELSKWLKANARPCPDCHRIVSRSAGCDQMKCVCGADFRYCCGFKKCQCSVPAGARGDIWSPGE
mmetsp:Transcript_49583/g.153068  ORF Transcript_49583/g.153068 Transcript_49583/m.153068 type:complete len:312 (+) Transcript_49583:216-1151(+)